MPKGTEAPPTVTFVAAVGTRSLRPARPSRTAEATMPMASRATTPTTIPWVIRRLRCTLAASSRARSRACWRLLPLPFWVVFAGCFGTVGTLSVRLRLGRESTDERQPRRLDRRSDSLQPRGAKPAPEKKGTPEPASTG